MKIKKIIREEIEELQWIQDIDNNPFDINRHWVLINDVDPNSMEESREMQKLLFDLGYKWNAPRNSPIAKEIKNSKIYAIFHFPTGGLQGKLTFYNSKPNEMDMANRDINDYGYEVYYWSHFKQTQIQESDDFQWIHDIKPNKWSVFEEVIKEDPNINISKSNDGSWYNFYDEMRLEYLGWEFFDEYELNKDIKENDMGEFIIALEKHIEMTWDYREDKYDKDYMDFMELLRILKKINKQY